LGNLLPILGFQVEGIERSSPGIPLQKTKSQFSQRNLFSWTPEDHSTLSFGASLLYQYFAKFQIKKKSNLQKNWWWVFRAIPWNLLPRDSAETLLGHPRNGEGKLSFLRETSNGRTLSSFSKTPPRAGECDAKSNRKGLPHSSPRRKRTHWRLLLGIQKELTWPMRISSTLTGRQTASGQRPSREP
jgi:hypothetical protein